MISTTARALALTLALATNLPAQVPQLLNYQGRVAVGTVNFDGAGQFKFAFVNGDGSTTYWSNDGTSSTGSEPASAVTIVVTKGLYSVLLGDTTLSNMMAIPPGVFSNPDVRLRVWFDDGVNGSQQLSPDQRIAAVGYAMMAGGLNLPPTSGADAGVILQNGSPLLHTFGSRNYFSGFSVGNFTLTGADNTAVGHNALTLNTTGNKNAAIGSGVLAANTTGLLNTASGFEALNANVIGNQNTATGAYALHTTISNNNTASGYQALLSDSSGSGNSAFGWQSLKNNTTGSNNIALGKGAGADLTTGSNNIDIGNSGVAGESNIIRIGSTQTDTYLTGVIHGDGSGLTGITATGLAAASVTSTQLAADLTLGGTTTVSGILSLPPSTGVNTGVINQDGSPLLHTFGTKNLFAGGAGNFTTTGVDNTVVGVNALTLNTSGTRNAAFGNSTLAANTSGTNNTAVGFEALKANITGGQNTAFGTYALEKATASTNTAIGYSSLSDNTTGQGNTAIGWLALSGNTLGQNNIALGKRAGQDLTTGSDNIVIGHRGIAGESNTIRIGDGVTQTDTYLTGVIHGDGSGLTGITATGLAAASVTSTQLAGDLTLSGTTTVSGILSLPPSTGVNTGVINQDGNPLLHTFGTQNFFAGGAGNFTTTGVDNAVVGFNALTLNTSGTRNVVFGNSALAANTDGTNNTAVGFEALKSNTTGDQNTAFGTYSLTLSNASYSTAFGYLSLSRNTTGDQNTAIGWQALSDNTTGEDNIALGFRAGQDLTTGSNNIVIGHRGIAGESNTIRIGDGVTQTDTYLTGVVHGDGSGLTNIPPTSITPPPPGMALIPAGTFTMGNSVAADTDITDADPVATTVSAFYMDATEVTLSQWQAVYLWALDQGYSFANAGAGKAANHPVHSVRWYDCVKWCNARSEQAGKTPVYYTDAEFTMVYRTGEVEVFANWAAVGYRLPTEAEWEMAARGGASGLRFPWADRINQYLANYTGDTASYTYDLGPDGVHPLGGASNPRTSPVTSFVANGYGLYDMAGNVIEWCWDVHATPYAGGTDPRGSPTGSIRVVRGGGWNSNADRCRSAYTRSLPPDDAYNNLGFRAVLAPGK